MQPCNSLDAQGLERTVDRPSAVHHGPALVQRSLSLSPQCSELSRFACFAIFSPLELFFWAPT